jgi:DNA repair protein RadC
VKALALHDRPREKMLRHGALALGDNELVALVLGSGRRGADAIEVANELLDLSGALHGVARATIGDLARVPGVGLAKAAQLLAAVELGRRTVTHAPSARVQLRTPKEAAAYLLPAFGARPVEHFGIVLLDTRHRVLRTTIIATGTLNTTIVQPRDVYRTAMLGGAAAIVAFHNHPSGDPTPSHEDGDLTRRLSAAGTLLGIALVDHLVLADTRYYSFRELGQI